MNAIDQFARLYSPEAEQSVIGGLLLDSCAADSLGGLRPEHFYTESHRIIFAEIMRMVAEGHPVDVVTVAESLEVRGLSEQTGGLAYLGDLAQHTPSARNVGRYAKTVISKSLERQLLGAADTIRETVSGTGPTHEKLMAAQHAVMAITEAATPKSPRLMRDVLVPVVDTLERRAAGERGGLPTGFADLDQTLTGGLKPGNLVIIAGRPGMGKTSLAVQMAYGTSIESNPALVLSMEMSDGELTDRLIALAGNVPLHEVLAGNMAGEAGERILFGVQRLRDLPLVIDDQGSLTLFDVSTKARSVKRKHGLSLLVVDYLQLMQGDGEDNRNQQIEQISRGLKGLAKELEIPVVALSQLNRSLEQRVNKRPLPSDLRDSGSLEQDADVILFVYRDEVYHADSPDKGTAEIIVAKNRQGKTGTVRLAFRGHTTSFADLAPGWTPAYREEKKPTRKGRLDDY